MRYGFDFGIYLVYLTCPTCTKKRIKDDAQNCRLQSHDSPYRSIGHQGDDYSPVIPYKLRTLREEIKSFKVHNNRLVEAQEIFARAQEKHVEVNTTIP